LKSLVQDQIACALAALVDSGELAADALPEVAVERIRGGEHGDFASPIALALARVLRRKPRDIAQRIAALLPADARIARVDVAGPGFLNFFLAPAALTQVVANALAAGDAYGHSAIGAGHRVQVEFVSANPTGPLHVGHGRGAAYGAAVANLLHAAGYAVEREYYINDAGRQMDILALSTWLRYLERYGVQCPFPSKGYQGGYVRDMAASLAERVGDDCVVGAAALRDALPADPVGDDKAAEAAREAHMDALIARTKKLLGRERYASVFAHARDIQVGDIRDDLAQFGVVFDRWFSEQSLADSDAVEHTLARLKDSGHAYEERGTLWFRSTAFGDEKDRVVVRENGAATYFASDIAYIEDKFARGFDHLIYVWGADHHGYIARLKAAAAALGHDPQRAEILLVQFAQLFRGGHKVQMSTRSGEYVTLRELREEVGRDAARFFYVMRRSEQHLDFDLDLAKSNQKENPVYYVQYAHARIASNLRRAEERGLAVDLAQGLAALARLELEPEQVLMRTLWRFPEMLEGAARAREPHQVAFYLRDLANDFHAYYATDGVRLLDDDAALRNARLALCAAVAQVIRNGLALLGVSAPESM
jgi:arginyl-tRNA synthetase